VPGMREIKGAVLGRLPYYLVWQLPIALPSFLPFLIAFGSFDLLITAHITAFCSCFFHITALQLFLPPLTLSSSSSWHLVRARLLMLPPLESHLMLAARLIILRRLYLTVSSAKDVSISASNKLFIITNNICC